MGAVHSLFSPFSVPSMQTPLAARDSLFYHSLVCYSELSRPEDHTACLHSRLLLTLTSLGLNIPTSPIHSLSLHLCPLISFPLFFSLSLPPSFFSPTSFLRSIVPKVLCICKYQIVMVLLSYKPTKVSCLNLRHCCCSVCKVPRAVVMSFP